MYMSMCMYVCVCMFMQACMGNASQLDNYLLFLPTRHKYLAWRAQTPFIKFLYPLYNLQQVFRKPVLFVFPSIFPMLKTGCTVYVLQNKCTFLFFSVSILQNRLTLLYFSEFVLQSRLALLYFSESFLQSRLPEN